MTHVLKCRASPGCTEPRVEPHVGLSSLWRAYPTNRWYTQNTCLHKQKQKNDQQLPLCQLQNMTRTNVIAKEARDLGPPTNQYHCNGYKKHTRMPNTCPHFGPYRCRGSRLLREQNQPMLTTPLLRSGNPQFSFPFH